MHKEAIWIPPSLCGCKLRIAAEWPNADDIVDGVVYRHPKPFTITDVQIVNVCDEHKAESESMPDTSDLFDIDNITGELKQTRGYLKYPIDNPTPAQNLYTHFYYHKGQIHGYPCGCQTFQHIDHNDVLSYKHHDRHHRRCYKHKDDKMHMPNAKQEFDDLQAMENNN